MKSGTVGVHGLRALRVEKNYKIKDWIPLTKGCGLDGDGTLVRSLFISESMLLLLRRGFHRQGNQNRGNHFHGEDYESLYI